MPGGLFCVIGNPLNDGKWTYTWENGWQLARMQSIDTDAQFVYNENGLRGKKTVNEVVTDYILHGKNIVHMKRGDDELHFFYDAQNRPAVVVYNGTAYAYVKSLQGDIVAILDENGNAVVSYGYDAWGAPLWCTGELAETLGKVQPFRYRGYVFDEETGLYYLRSRYYNAQWGRFVNADALITDNTGLLCQNLFAYCCNEPVRLEDSEGTWPWDTIVKSVIAVTVVVAVAAACALTAGAALVAVGATTSMAVSVGTVTAAAGIASGSMAVANEAITKPDEDWDYGRIATDTFFGSAHGFVDAMTAGKSRFLKAGYKIVLAACWKMANCFHDGVSINDTIHETYDSIGTASVVQILVISASRRRGGSCCESILVSCPIDYGRIMWSSSGVRTVSGIGKYVWKNIEEKELPLGDAIKGN